MSDAAVRQWFDVHDGHHDNLEGCVGRVHAHADFQNHVQYIAIARVEQGVTRETNGCRSVIGADFAFGVGL